MATFGFIGLGVMGSQMVNRLLSKGHAVTGYNRTRGKAQWLIEKGMKWADSPREVASAADVIFAMVTNASALQSIADGPCGVLAGISKGKIFVDMRDRKSTRLNSSHQIISYAVFCLKKKKTKRSI